MKLQQKRRGGGTRVSGMVVFNAYVRRYGLPLRAARRRTSRNVRYVYALQPMLRAAQRARSRGIRLQWLSASAGFSTAGH